MQSKTFITLTFLILTIISSVHAWITVGLSYKICDTTFTDDVIHINEHDAHFYTNSTKVKKITTDNQTSDGFVLNVTMYGCQDNCGWSFDLKVDNSTRKVTPVASKQLPYTCTGNPNTWRVDLNTKVLSVGETPNPDYPFSFNLAMHYCKNNYNIDNNTAITGKDVKNNYNCLRAYSDKMYDPSTIFNFENDGNRWPFMGQKPAALSLAATVDNAFTFYQNHYLGLKYSFSNLTENMVNHLTDFAPFYNHAPDESISYDISGTLQLLTDHFKLNLLQVGTIFVDSVSDQPTFLDKNGAPLKRTVSIKDFYYKVPFDASGTMKNTFKNFGQDKDSFLKKIIDKLPNTVNGNIDVFTPSSKWLAAPFYVAIELVNFGSLDVRNFVQPTLNAAVASTILNHYGLTYCNHVNQDLCGKCCLAQVKVTRWENTCYVRGSFDCDNIKKFVNFADYWHYDYCKNNENGWSINSGDCINESTIRCSAFPNGCNSYSCAPSPDSGKTSGDCNHCDG
ncbi:12424_t:CDS:2 [Funneliformis mosseae]|uniref:12424_t:CDS:1 n=1 Tax=Funneliformis mosseae TaxID=27381 RepID=A0A9N9HCT2_FUNMO|nr:12424_t:CDS:2 [Funneliformis mosseae]